MSNVPRRLTRNQLSEFLPNARAVRAFEQMLDQISDLLIEDVGTAAASADARAVQCLDTLNRIADSLELLATSPVVQAKTEPVDDLSPSTQIGTLGQQQHDNVSITGGLVAANLTNNQPILLKSSVALSNAAAAALATMTNAPVVGNPTKWVSIDDNGTTRRIPTW